MKSAYLKVEGIAAIKETYGMADDAFYWSRSTVRPTLFNKNKLFQHIESLVYASLGGCTCNTNVWLTI